MKKYIVIIKTIWVSKYPNTYFREEVEANSFVEAKELALKIHNISVEDIAHISSRVDTKFTDRVNLDTKEYRLPTFGRVSNILSSFDSPTSVIHRKDIAGTTYSSMHVELAEVLGLIERIPLDKRPAIERLLLKKRSRLDYKITDIGWAALKIIKDTNKRTIVVPVKVDNTRLEHFKTKNW